MAENRVQITINGDGSNAIAASKQVRNEYSLLSSQLQTGIQQAAYGVDAGTARIAKSYRDMSSQVRAQTRQMRDDTIRDVTTMNDRILQYAEETRRREASVWQTPDELRARWGLSPRDDQARMDAGLQPLGNQQYASDSMQQGISEQSAALGVASLKWGLLGSAVGGAVWLFDSAIDHFAEMGRKAIENAENLNKLSVQLGMTASALQDLQGASMMSGVKMDVLTAAVRNLQAASRINSDEGDRYRAILQGIGISMEDASGRAKTWSQLLGEISGKFASWEDGSQKAKIATELLGSSESELLMLLNKGPETLETYLQAYDRLGTKRSQDEIDRVAKMQESLRLEEAQNEMSAKAIGETWIRWKTDIYDTLHGNLMDWNQWGKNLTDIWSGLTSIAKEKAERIVNYFNPVPFVPMSNRSTAGESVGGISIYGTAAGSAIGAAASTGKSTPPTVLSSSDFEKTLTQRRNMEANLFTWESDATAKYWRDAYNWASSYYGKESTLAKDLWNKYADSARAAYRSAESGGSGADPFGVEQVREKIHQIDADFRTMYREYRNEQYAFWIQEKELQGQSYEAERLKNFQWLENAAAALRQQSEKVQNDIQTLADKKNASRGMTPDAEALIDREITRLTELKNLDEQRYQELLKQYELREKMAAKIQLREAAEVAQVNLSYTQLTSTMEDQIRAQLALNEAQKQAKLQEVGGEVTELGQAYKRLYDEQERLLRLNNGEYGSWEAFKQGLKDAQQSAGTMNQAIRQGARDLISELGSGFKTFWSQIWRGELKNAGDYFRAFCDVITNAFGNALSNMMSKMLESQLSSLFGAIPGIGSLFGTGAGGGGGTASLPAGWLPTGWPTWAPTSHSGLAPGQSPTTYKVVPSWVFAGARRYHSGLAADEFPAILQRGEEVRSRDQVRADRAAGRQPINVQVSIDNQSSTPLKLEQGSVTQGIDKLVIGIVAKDIDENGVLGRMFRGRR